MKSIKTLMAVVLAVVMFATTVMIEGMVETDAAVKIVFGKKLSMTVGSTDMIVVKGKATAKSANKKIARVGKIKKGKQSTIIVKGLKTGKTKVTVKVKRSKKKVSVSVNPKTVKNVSAKLTSNSTARISWASAKGAIKYDVYCSENKESGFSKIASVKTTFFDHKNIPQGTFLYYKVKSIGKSSTRGSFSKVSKRVKTWKQIWNDEFSGTKLDMNKWNNKDASGGGGYGNGELQNYQLDYCEVKDGDLVIKPTFKYDKSAKKGVKDSYYSTKLWTKGQHTFQYVKVEMRVKMPKGQGTWAAGWMLGTIGGWPACGEIDIFETTSLPAKTLIPQSIHCTKFNGAGGNSPNKHFDSTVKDATSAYHTYGIEWLNDGVKFTIDGKETWVYDPLIYSSKFDYMTDDAAWPFKQPFYLILNCAIGGTLGGNVTPSYWTKVKTQGNIETYEDYMYIDSVRVYQ